MRMLTSVLSIVVIALAVAALVFVLYGRERTWTTIAGPADLGPIDLTEVQRTQKPHDALLCTQGLCNGVDVDATLPAYNQSPEELIASLDGAAKQTTDRLTRVDDGSDPHSARYVTRSNLMRYPDTVWLQATTLEDGSTGLMAYARAQIGHSDLGANKARLESWIAQLPNE